MDVRMETASATSVELQPGPGGAGDAEVFMGWLRIIES